MSREINNTNTEERDKINILFSADLMDVLLS